MYFRQLQDGSFINLLLYMDDILLSPVTLEAAYWRSGPEQRTGPTYGTRAGRTTWAGVARKTRASLIQVVSVWALGGEPILGHLSHRGYFGNEFG